MTIIDRLRASCETGIDPETVYEAADTIERLQSENTALRLYAPARRAQPTVKSKQIAPTNWPAWGMIDETDEEFAERAGRKVEFRNGT